MKRAINIIFICLTTITLSGQMKIDKRLDFSGKSRIVLAIQITDSIRINTWNKDEVYLTASVNINNNADNKAYETEFSDSGKEIHVKAGFSEDYFKGKKDCCVESEISWVVFIPERSDLKLETINGDVTITGKTGPLNIKSISGFIDLTVPENRPVSLDFSTISGTVYSNHLLSSTDSRTGIPSRIRLNLNNGGEPVKVETISGDIFFRK